MSACGYSLDVDQRRFHIGRRDADTCGQRARHYRTMLRSIRDQKPPLFFTAFFVPVYSIGGSPVCLWMGMAYGFKWVSLPNVN